MRRFYYDTAQAFDPVTIAALRTMVPASQMVFGTDYPYRTADDHVVGLAKLDLPAADLAAIGRGNAMRLLLRLV